MDAERALLTSIAVFGRGLDEATAAGFTPDALIHDDCREALRFIIFYEQSHGSQPSFQFLNDSVKFNTEMVEAPFEVLLEAWRDSYTRRRTIEFVRETLGPATNDPQKIAHLAAMMTAKGEELSTFSSRSQLTVTSSDNVDPETVFWFWRVDGIGWIPHDALSVLVGDPGEGKGLLGTWLSAYATGLDVSVGILGHEDSKGLQRARLDAAGSGPVSFIEKGNGEPLSFPSDVGLLRQAIEANGLGLVIVDPINSHMDDGIRSSDDKDVRRCLSPLALVAQDLGVMVLVVHHMSKGTVGQKLLYRAGGAAAYSGVARSVLALGKKNVDEDDDEDEANSRYIFQSKSNYARATNVPLKFTIEEIEIDVKTRAGLPAVEKVAAFNFKGTCEDVDQLDVFSPPRGPGRPKDEGLRKWIDEQLDGKSEVVSSHLEDAAHAHGFAGSWRTIKNVMRDELDWTSHKVGSAWVWRKSTSPFLKLVPGGDEE